MFAVRTESARGLAALGAVALGVLMMLLLLPAMASANPAAPAASSPPAPEAPAELTMAEPASSEAAPPPASGPAPAEETSEPAPPPAYQPEQPAPAPAPASDAQPSPPLTTPPDAPESPAAESAPEPEAALMLPASPGYPGTRGAIAADKMLAAAPAPPASSPSPVSAPTSPPDAPAGLGAATSDASAAGGVVATVARKALPPRSGFVEALGGVQSSRRAALAIDRDAGPGPAGVAVIGPDGENPFDTIAATDGPAPAGSSLLAVLASYAIPGGGVPTSTLILFMQLAVILIAVYAPRSGFGERLLALGRLGPRFGYRTVLARPG